jgi:TonB family protein
MRPISIVFVLLVPVSLWAQQPASSELEKPFQICTPLTAPHCATLPCLKEGQKSQLPKKNSFVGEEVVIVDLVVSREGETRELELIQSAEKEANQIAMAAVRAWKFDPDTYQGHPVPTEVRIRIAFHPTGDPTILMGSTSVSSVGKEEFDKLFAAASQALARRDYHAAVARANELIILVPLATRIRIVLGMSLLELDQYAEAEAALKDEIKLEPSSVDAYDRLGTIYWREHKYDEAITQFKKQIEVTPDSFNAHADLGVLLCGRKKCKAAMPELDKALAISANQARVVLAHGECNVDLGNLETAVREMQQAASQSGSADSWNLAAYRLADHNVELERAEKWSETAITIGSAQLQSLSLDHLTPTQMRLAHRIASYWDTRGWVYFRKADFEKARDYTEPAWRLHPSPTMGNHLGQIYEKLARPEDAARAYAMAIASAELPTKSSTSPEDLAEAMDRLGKLAGTGASIPELIQRGKADMEDARAIVIENSQQAVGTADFLMKVGAGGVSETRQVSGDAKLAIFSGALQKAKLPVQIPEAAALEIPRRGTLRCRSGESQCHFLLLRSEEALDLAMKEALAENPKSAE